MNGLDDVTREQATAPTEEWNPGGIVPSLNRVFLGQEEAERLLERRRRFEDREELRDRLRTIQEMALAVGIPLLLVGLLALVFVMGRAFVLWGAL